MANVKSLAGRRLLKKIRFFNSRCIPKIIDPEKVEIRGITDSSGFTQWTPVVEVLVDLGIPVNESRIVIDVATNTLKVSHGSYPRFSFLDSYWQHVV